MRLNPLSVSKSENRSKYSFEKKQVFFTIMSKVLSDLGFEERIIRPLGRPWDEEQEGIDMSKEVKINTYKDKIENFSNENYSVDIIYFSKTIFVIFNSKENKQQEIANAFMKSL